MNNELYAWPILLAIHKKANNLSGSMNPEELVDTLDCLYGHELGACVVNPHFWIAAIVSLATDSEYIY